MFIRIVKCADRESNPAHLVFALLSETNVVSLSAELYFLKKVGHWQRDILPINYPRINNINNLGLKDFT